jgi:hypothetical protein
LTKKITFYEPFGLNLQLFETVLELAQLHLDKGHDVEFVTCNAILPVCEINPQKSITVCSRCISRRNHGISLLSKKVKIKSISSFSFLNKHKNNLPKTDFETVEELKNYKINDFNIGAGVYSSVLDQAKYHKIDINEYRDLTNEFLITSFFIYRNFINYLSRNNTSRVYLFNGRHSTGKPIIAACKKFNKEFYTYEFHFYYNKFILCKNTQPHDYIYMAKEANKLWTKGVVDKEKREAVAKSFFYRKSKKYQSLDFSKKQEDGLLPLNWDKKKHNIVFFTSSEFESYAAFDYKEKSVYENHFAGILRILIDLNHTKHNIHIYIRLHPNLSTVPKSLEEVHQYSNLKFNFLSVISPEDPVDSYSIMKNADKVMTYISSTSMESSFIGKPTILLSKNLVGFMNCCYLPQTHREVMNLILDDKLPPLDNTGALKYGYFWEKWGHAYKYYRNKSLQNGIFKGVKVDVSEFVENFLLRNYHRPKLKIVRFVFEKLFKKFCIFYTN